MTIVRKFGGSSVADAAAIQQVAAIMASDPRGLVVVSALGGVTDTLLELVTMLRDDEAAKARTLVGQLRDRHLQVADQLKLKDCRPWLEEECERLSQWTEALIVLGELSPRSQDALCSLGERLSAPLVSEALRQGGCQASSIGPEQLVCTDSHFTEAEVDFPATRRNVETLLKPALKRGIVVTGGFVGSDSKGRLTTLGRGGSDYSAAVLASVLKADRVEIWTDVDGVMTCDPRMVPEACLVPRLSYDEAAELAYFGAKVLHPKTIFPAVAQNIPVQVRNTRRPQGGGTEILPSTALPSGNTVKAIAFRQQVTMISISSNRMLGASGFLGRVFRLFEEQRVPVDLISTSEVNVSLTVEREAAISGLVAQLEAFSAVQIREDCSSISIVGQGIRQTSAVAARLFARLQDTTIRMITFGGSEVNLSVVIPETQLAVTLAALHTTFFGN